MTSIRCERGADIAAMLEFPAATAEAIRNLDEHWDGSGHPMGLKGQSIPLFGRIACLAQTVAVFSQGLGIANGYQVARKRSGAWFDPELVRTLESFRGDTRFWSRLLADDVRSHLKPMEPADRMLFADDAKLDRIAEAFARIVDANSPFTFRHSELVASFAVSIGSRLGFSAAEQVQLRRAGLLHDIGKLGVSNLILDKAGPLNDSERVEMRRHPDWTHEILLRVATFRGFAEVAASHHERPDGKGYHRGLGGDAFDQASRVLAVADCTEALTAERPYRGSLPFEEVMRIMGSKRGTGLCERSLAVVEEIGPELLAIRDSGIRTG